MIINLLFSLKIPWIHYWEEISSLSTGSAWDVVHEDASDVLILSFHKMGWSLGFLVLWGCRITVNTAIIAHGHNYNVPQARERKSSILPLLLWVFMWTARPPLFLKVHSYSRQKSCLQSKKEMKENETKVNLAAMLRMKNFGHSCPDHTVHSWMQVDADSHPWWTATDCLWMSSIYETLGTHNGYIDFAISYVVQFNLGKM